MDIRITLWRVCTLSVVAIMGMSIGSVGWASEVVLAHGPIATLKSSPSGLSWEPRVPYKRLVLVVKAPGGKIIRHEYSPGSKLVYGGKLADGQYTYELSVVPLVAPEVRQALEKSRATGDRSIVEELRAKGALPRGPHAQSGYFRVYGGAVIPPQGVEPRYRGK